MGLAIGASTVATPWGAADSAEKDKNVVTSITAVLYPIIDPVIDPVIYPVIYPIIYEDADLLILSKPSGIPSHPLRQGEEGTAVSAALAHCPELCEIKFPKTLESGLIHRLDTGTSGILVFAKNLAEYERLRLLWKKKEVQKIYRALVSESPLALPKILDWSLAHSKKSSKKMICLLPGKKIKFRGKAYPAHTALLRAEKTKSGLLDLEIEIKTGVTHQIRCHLAEFGYPVCGDSVYGGPKAERLWLHAWKLSFLLKSGVRLSLVSDLPEGWVFAPYSVKK